MQRECESSHNGCEDNDCSLRIEKRENNNPGTVSFFLQTPQRNTMTLLCGWEARHDFSVDKNPDDIMRSEEVNWTS